MKGDLKDSHTSLTPHPFTRIAKTGGGPQPAHLRSSTERSAKTDGLPSHQMDQGYGNENFMKSFSLFLAPFEVYEGEKKASQLLQFIIRTSKKLLSRGTWRGGTGMRTRTTVSLLSYNVGESYRGSSQLKQELCARRSCKIYDRVQWITRQQEPKTRSLQAVRPRRIGPTLVPSTKSARNTRKNLPDLVLKKKRNPS
ncbi:unnamed protein product [Nesidiocoris tenuis]|uniref:Uncharacterized protein n=1 Tax=Nesidiocoris tenuis TaxID=355587 RepID=A0A6H5HBA0_9HEMI|nr:unnamed protein product [Nesidiocoris tenuis]